MITALNIANNFLEKAFNENIPITPMKIQKLIYIMYKEYLKKTKLKLFSENFEAWQYGPVLPNVYSEFKPYRGSAIKNYALNADGSISKVQILPTSNFDYVFNDVWNKYKKFSGVELSEFTHKKEGAWKKSIENKTFILKDLDILAEESYV